VEKGDQSRVKRNKKKAVGAGKLTGRKRFDYKSFRQPVQIFGGKQFSRGGNRVTKDTMRFQKEFPNERINEKWKQYRGSVDEKRLQHTTKVQPVITGEGRG